MTPEERFMRIENSLDTIAGYQAKFEAQLLAHDKWLNRLEVIMETAFHELNLKMQKLTEFHGTLMESQNSAWRAIERLANSR